MSGLKIFLSNCPARHNNQSRLGITGSNIRRDGNQVVTGDNNGDGVNFAREFSDSEILLILPYAPTDPGHPLREIPVSKEQYRNTCNWRSSIGGNDGIYIATGFKGSEVLVQKYQSVKSGPGSNIDSPDYAMIILEPERYTLSEVMKEHSDTGGLPSVYDGDDNVTIDDVPLSEYVDKVAYSSTSFSPTKNGQPTPMLAASLII